MNRNFLAVLILSIGLVPLSANADEEADRIAAAHAHDKPVATPMAEPPGTGVNSRVAIYTIADGRKVEGWLSWPADRSMEGLPGVIVIHEWWGLNDNIRETSARLAAEGYVTLAVDLYGGEVAEIPKDAMKLMQGLTDDADNGRTNLAAAYDYLHNAMGLEKVGIIGWCLGGRWSLQGSLHMPEDIDATVIYYGGVTADKAQLETLQMPILGHFASQDPIVPVPTVVAFRDALAELNKDAQIFIYPHTKHAFSNPSGMAYQPVAAERAWQRTIDFFWENLQ